MAQFTESVPADQKSFTTAFGYDSYGNNTTINYPGGFNIKYVFNYGYLNEIRKEDNSLIWKLDASTSLLQPLHYTLGPGNIPTEFSYDTLGFLTKKVTAGWKQTFKFENYTGNLLERGYRNMSVQDSLRETFTYDNLERLTSSAVTGQQGVSLSYDCNGNILSKTGVGAYEYLQDKINAVSYVSGNPGSVPSTLQEISYTSFNKPDTISEGINKLEITYGPDQQRVKTVLKENGNIVKTKYYSINLDQEITSAGTRNIYYLYSPYGLVAINIRKNNIDSLYFTDTDHLGSIVAMLNPDGTIREQYSYDPWGKRRNPENWTYSGVPNTFLIERGYTGHEHLDRFNLINMNGRVYDPVLGRFLSPDPIIQSPDFTQSFNSYSYCVNNPLKYYDPSGYLKQAYDSYSIEPHQFATFIESLFQSHNLDRALTESEAIARTIYWDDETGIFEFWIQGGSVSYCPSGDGSGDLTNSTVEIYLEHKSIWLPTSNFYNYIENIVDEKIITSSVSGGNTWTLDPINLPIDATIDKTILLSKRNFLLADVIFYSRTTSTLNGTSIIDYSNTNHLTYSIKNGCISISPTSWSVGANAGSLSMSLGQSYFPAAINFYYGIKNDSLFQGYRIDIYPNFRNSLMVLGLCGVSNFTYKNVSKNVSKRIAYD